MEITSETKNFKQKYGSFCNGSLSADEKRYNVYVMLLGINVRANNMFKHSELMKKVSSLTVIYEYENE